MDGRANKFVFANGKSSRSSHSLVGMSKVIHTHTHRTAIRGVLMSNEY